MQPKERAQPLLDSEFLQARIGSGRATLAFRKGEVVFTQGDSADAIFQIQKGKLKLTVVSSQGKEAVIALLAGGDFFGEGGLLEVIPRAHTAVALEDSELIAINTVDNTASARLDVPGLIQGNLSAFAVGKSGERNSSHEIGAARAGLIFGHFPLL